MGLGLASSQHICKALKGKLYLERSAENEGTSIRFIIEIKMGEPFSKETLEQNEINRINSLMNNSINPVVMLNNLKKGSESSNDEEVENFIQQYQSSYDHKSSSSSVSQDSFKNFLNNSMNEPQVSN